jgi:hypothetical protein
MAEKMGLIDLIKKIFRVKNSRLKILNPAASRSRKNSEFECACHVKNSSFIRIDRPDAAVSRSAIICFMGIWARTCRMMQVSKKLADYPV